MKELITRIKELFNANGNATIAKGMERFTAGLDLMKAGVDQNNITLVKNNEMILQLKDSNAALSAANNETTTIIRNFERLILSK